MTTRQRASRKQEAIYAKLEDFFQQMEKEYGVSREELLSVAEKVGAIKGRIRTYFSVREYERKKGRG